MTGGIGRGAWCVYGLALAGVAGIGALNLNYPFIADHIIALLGAKSLAAGGTLYVDFWDNKMPGLFWFYQLAGTLFGFDEFGIHLLDLIWMTSFALVLMLCLRAYCAFPWLSALAPIAVVGSYYAAADAFHLTQVEILVALPLFLIAWLVSRDGLAGWRLGLVWAVSGVLGGIVVVFKLVFAPLVVALWLTAVVHAWFRARIAWRHIVVRMLIPAFCGLGLCLAAVLLEFRSDGALDALWWTAFEYPPQALVSAPRAPYLRLAESTLYFLSFYLPWAFFIVLALADWVYRERHLLTTLMLVWLITAVGVIVIQRFSWWPYHFLLLFTPCGVLGVRGLGVIPRVLLERGVISRHLAAVVAVALALPAVAALAVPVEQKIAAHIDVYVRKLPPTPTLQIYVNHDYTRINRSVRFLQADTARPGPIYVFGDPLYYHLSGRMPALPIPGWPWQYFLQSQWVHVPRQLAQALPAYIYIDKDNDRMMRVRGGGVREYIQSAYAPFTTDYNGVWYQIRPDLWHARHGPPASRQP